MSTAGISLLQQRKGIEKANTFVLLMVSNSRRSPCDTTPEGRVSSESITRHLSNFFSQKHQVYTMAGLAGMIGSLQSSFIALVMKKRHQFSISPYRARFP